MVQPKVKRASDKRVKPLSRCAPEAKPAAWVDDLCIWLSAGKTLRGFCRQPGRPANTTIYEKIRDNEEIASRIARAREIGHDTIADECLEIAEDGTNDYVQTRNGPVLDSEHVQRSKLRIETRLKLLSKWSPKKYGDKQQHEHTGTFTVTLSKDDSDIL